MSKKGLAGIGLAPLLAVAALAAMPVAGNAAGTHYYKNGAKIVEGTRVPTISWGTLTLSSTQEAPMTCKTVVGAYSENPEGGGPGVSVTQNFATYECAGKGCPLENRLEGIINATNNENGSQGWFGHVTETEGTSRLQTTGIELVLGCWLEGTSKGKTFGGPTGPGNVSTTERGEPVAVLLKFRGTSTPKLKNGTTAASPSRIEFGAGSGELTPDIPEVGPGKITGSLATLGYGEEESIRTGA